MTDVLVVGGGPAGLAAAVAAARRGRSVRLVEAAPALGGMAASTTVAGVRVDHGSHRLHPVAPPRVRRLLDELLGDDLQQRERHGRLRLRDRWVGFPFRPADLIRSVPPSFAAAAARDAVVRPLRRPGGDSYADVVRAGLGPAALDAFHGPMATKLWGLPPERLSGELARKRIPVRSPGVLLRTIARTSRPGGRTFLYPRRGFGQIVDRMADAAAAAGARLETATAVDALVPGTDGVAASIGGSPPERVGRVLWTAPLPALRRALGLGDGEADVVHRGLVLAYLVVPQRTWTSFDAHYVPDADVAFSRISEPRNYRDGDDPSDVTVLCAEVPCSPEDDVWTAGPTEVGRLVLDGIGRCGLAVPPVEHVELRRVPAVYPVLTVDAPAARHETLAWSGALPGTTVLGRHGRVVADNTHHVVDMALAAVDCLGDDGRWDDDAWRAATARFETFTVED